MTPQQTRVIDLYASGASQGVQARAGTGKTTTLVAALQHAKNSTLAVAFNKKTADELKERLPSTIVSKTMNALGHAAWIKHLARRPTLDDKKLIKIVQAHKDSETLGDSFMDVVKLVKLAKSSGLNSGFNLPDPNFEDWLSIADAHDIIEAENLLPIAADVFKTSCLQAFQATIDFDDQIYCPVVYGSPFDRYQSVAVDEAQDLSPLQHRMIQRSLVTGGQLTVVGDPSQAIYGFRGASNTSFQDFIDKFELAVSPLTASFRCPRAVIREAQKYVPDIEAASSAEGHVEIVDHGLLPMPNLTMLSRTNAPLVRMAFQAIRKGVAPNMLGRDFLSGLKALHKKYPTLPALERWYDAESKTTNSAKKARAKDRYDAMRILHEQGDVLKAIEKIAAESRTNAMTLSTIHKAKGLEWNNVVYYDYFRDFSGEQEANIKYVGVTRAKHNLILHKEER